MIKMKKNVTPGTTPPEISVMQIDQDLKDGVSKSEMAIKYGIKPWEVDEMFKHSFLKGRRPSRKKALSFTFVDDTCEDAEVVAITSEDGDPVIIHNPNQVTLEDAIDEAIESVEEVKDQMQETQEAILDMLSPTGFEPKTTKEFVDDLVEMNDRDSNVTDEDFNGDEFPSGTEEEQKAKWDSIEEEAAELEVAVEEELEDEDEDDNTFDL